MTITWFLVSALIGLIIGFCVYKFLFYKKVDQLHTSVIDEINAKYKKQIEQLKIVSQRPLTNEEIIQELNKIGRD